jgi:mannose-1-phosphate guanylyltransferase/mannose-6-phosphate isomerase
MRRNTAPAIAIAAWAAMEIDKEATMVVMPSDHHISNANRFVSTVLDAAALADEKYLVTFGVLPTRPDTGYGYIQLGPSKDHWSGAFVIKRFVEKPDFDTASDYVESGKYLWNSGMFVFRAAQFLKELELYDPETAFACRNAYSQGRSDLDFYRVDKESFSSCASNSIDYAVMEKTHNGVVLPLNAGWCDLGSWESIREVKPKDIDQNVTCGDVMLVDVKQSTIVSTHRLVGALGLRNCVVVETPDAVFVSTRDKANVVQTLVHDLSIAKRDEAVLHNKVHRPWGHYTKLNTEPLFLVKHLVLKPGGAISLQTHHHRAEHWIVIKGTAHVIRGDEQFLLNENESTFIPLDMLHRLENPYGVPLELVEIQTGTYLNENDIVRVGQ